MRNVEKIKTHILSPVIFFFNCAIYEIMWKYVELDRPHMTKWHIHVAGWITKATNTLRICNTTFPLQQWLHRHAWLLCYIVQCLPCFLYHLLELSFVCHNVVKLVAVLAACSWSFRFISVLRYQLSLEFYGFPQPIQAYAVVPQLRSWLLLADCCQFLSRLKLLKDSNES